MTDARGPFADFFGRLWRQKPLGIASAIVNRDPDSVGDLCRCSGSLSVRSTEPVRQAAATRRHRSIRTRDRGVAGQHRQRREQVGAVVAPRRDYQAGEAVRSKRRFGQTCTFRGCCRPAGSRGPTRPTHRTARQSCFRSTGTSTRFQRRRYVAATPTWLRCRPSSLRRRRSLRPAPRPRGRGSRRRCRTAPANRRLRPDAPCR